MIGAWLFLRLLAFAYLTAFAALYFQIDALIGPRGIAPYGPFLDYLHRNSSALGQFWRAPSLLWILPEGGNTLRVLTGGGTALALLLLCGKAERACLFLLWLTYLSLVSVDYVFLQFQWDHLLLEAGLLALFLPSRESGRFNVAPLPRLLLQLLLFRLMFGSGLVKLLSGDPEWSGLTALRHHYLTQPLPSLPAFYLYKLPPWFHTLSAATMFGIELVLPFFFFGPRALRHLAATATVALQLAIFCSGNYAFFNLLTIGLALILYDDRFFAERLPTIHQHLKTRVAETPRAATPTHALAPLGLLLFLASLQLLQLVSNAPLPRPLLQLSSSFAPLRLVNSYGLFAVMTTARDEIEIETSSDFKRWKPIRYRFKPQDLGAPPTQIAPYHPRLDWQLWFAALGSVKEHQWFLRLLELILQESPEIAGLLEPTELQQSPPKFIRALRYRYRFSSMSEQAIDRSWWKRELVGVYCPPLRLDARGGVVMVTAADLNGQFSSASE